MDFLVDMTTRVPRGTSPEALDDIRARESVRARELATEGHLLRLWRRTLTGKHAAARSGTQPHRIVCLIGCVPRLPV